MGYLIPYQCVKVGHLSHWGQQGRYVPVPEWWYQVEVCRGFWAAMDPTLTYRGSFLLLASPVWRFWEVFMVEFRGRGRDILPA